MDIVRKSNGTISKKGKKTYKFKYIDKTSKKRIRDTKTITYIESIKIPPAYKRVVISRNSRSKILAIGEDDKKRKQYIYNPKFTEKQVDVKFKELILFGKYIKRIRRDMRKVITDTALGKRDILSKETLISLVLFLVDNCHFRIGCEKYKVLYKTYGVTTLNKSHFTKINDKFDVEFVGKKGVVNKASVSNKEVCGVLNDLCKKNTGDYLFYSKESDKDKVRINEKHVNNFLKKYNENITVKMYRTWKANYILLREVLQYPLPENSEDSKKNLAEIIQSTAKKMHHTTSISKKSYMNNKIMDLYTNNPVEFKKVLMKFKKSNGTLPSVDRILSLLLKYFFENNK